MSAPEVDAPSTTTAEQDRQTAGERKIAEVAPPTTTRAQDLTAERQGAINVIWERTQQVLAVVVTSVGVGVMSFVVIRGGPNSTAALVSLSGTVALILATYFQRTNHVRSSESSKPGER